MVSAPRCAVIVPSRPRGALSRNDADKDFACQRLVIAEKCRHSFQRDKPEIGVAGITPVMLKMGDQFFLPFIAFVIFCDATFDCGGKFDVLLKFYYLFYEQAKQSMPLGRVDRGVKLLFKFNNVLLSDSHKPLRDPPIKSWARQVDNLCYHT